MKKRYRRSTFSQYLILGILIFIIFSFGYSATKVFPRVPYTDEFLLPWAASRAWLLESENPYKGDHEVFLERIIQNSDFLGILPDNASLTTPLVNLFFYLPLSLFPYEISRAIWSTIIAICIVGIAYLSLLISGWENSSFEKVGVILTFFLWMPSVYTIFRGQITPLIIFFILLGIFLMMKEQDTTAGFILSLTIGSLPISIIIVLSLLIWSISRRRLSVLIAYFSGAAFLLIISLLLLPSWPMDWLQIIIKTIENGDWLQTPLMLISSLLPGIESFLLIFLHSIVIFYLIVLLITIRKKIGLQFLWKISMILVLSVFLSIRSGVGWLFFILPGTFLIFKFWSERWRWKGRIITWAFMLFIVFGSWLTNYPELNFVEQVTSPLVIFVLPSLVLISMIWIRWWALKIPRIPDQIL